MYLPAQTGDLERVPKRDLAVPPVLLDVAGPVLEMEDLVEDLFHGLGALGDLARDEDLQETPFDLVLVFLLAPGEPGVGRDWRQNYAKPEPPGVAPKDADSIRNCAPEGLHYEWIISFPAPHPLSASPCLLRFAHPVGAALVALEQALVLQIDQDGVVLEEALLLNGLDDLRGLHRALLFQDSGDDLLRGARLVTMLRKAIHAAAHQHEAAVLDEFVVDGGGNRQAGVQLGVVDEARDILEMHRLLLFLQHDVDAVADGLGAHLRPFGQADVAKGITVDALREQRVLFRGRRRYLFFFNERRELFIVTAFQDAVLLGLQIIDPLVQEGLRFLERVLIEVIRGVEAVILRAEMERLGGGQEQAEVISGQALELPGQSVDECLLAHRAATRREDALALSQDGLGGRETLGVRGHGGQSGRFYLADALAGNVELLSDGFQGFLLAAIAQSETANKDRFLAVCKVLEKRVC